MPPTTQMPPVPPPGWAPQPMSGPPGYPPVSAPGYPVPPPPPAKKSNTGLIVGIIIGVVVLLCIGGVGAIVALNRLGRDSSPTAAGTSTPADGGITDPPDTSSAPTTPTGETYNMGIGDGVKVTDGDNQWAVSILDVHWYPKSCGDFATGTDPVLVLDVEFEVLQGTASLNTLFDFTFIDSDGADSTSTGFTFCPDPPLDDTFDLPAGEVRDGQIDFEVPSGKGGTLEYQELMDTDLIASWVIPGP